MTTVDAPLCISLFGEIKITKGTLHFPAFPTQKSRALFARLVLNAGRVFSREYLSELFWSQSNSDKARKCLRTELWRIRSVLEPGSDSNDNYLLVDNTGISFNSESNYWLDVADFESSLSRIRYQSQIDFTEQDCRSLKECIAYYKGDLLGLLRGDWFLLRREELRSQYLIALEMLVLYYMSNQDWNNAIIYANRLLSQDALLEHIHVYLMRCYHFKGHRPAAIMQYQQCKKLLSEELGVSPMPETESAYLDIIRRTSAPVNVLHSAVQTSPALQNTLIQTIKQALSNIRSAEKFLIQTSEQFYK